jgi:hypothetical protein
MKLRDIARTDSADHQEPLQVARSAPSECSPSFQDQSAIYRFEVESGMASPIRRSYGISGPMSRTKALSRNLWHIQTFPSSGCLCQEADDQAACLKMITGPDAVSAVPAAA